MLLTNRRQAMTRPQIEFHSSGPEGNIFYILGKVRDALRKQSRITDYNNLWEKVQNCKSYQEALSEIRQIVDLTDLDGAF